MTHELAKQLKDAGFPQRQLEVGDFTLCQHDKEQLHETNDTCEILNIPTLSELIEACVDISFSLNKTNTGFWIESVKGDTETYPTPEEAVANLWLALNKKWYANHPSNQCQKVSG